MDDSKPSKRDSTLDSQRSIQPDIRQHAFPLPTFSKTAIVIWVLAFVAYMYQVS